MLIELSVRNLALVETLNMHLEPGLIALTGETGAGKSIILDALGLLLGNRASSDLIRSGADAAFVEGLFTLDAHPEDLQTLLTEWGVALDDEQLIVSREVHTSGRTVCRVNGRMATVQMLRQLGRYLVQQHGQHEQHGLLQSDEQRRVLDLYGKHDALMAEVGQNYQRWKSLREALQQQTASEQERTRQLDMLAFQIDEIEKAHLQADEEEPLREERIRLQHLDKILSTVSGAVGYLDDSAGQMGGSAQIAEAVRELSAAVAFEPELSETLSMLETAQVHVDEAVRSLAGYLNATDIDEGRLEAVDERLNLIRSLQRKYGATVADVLQFCEEARRKREDLLRFEERTEALANECRAAEKSLADSSQRLHDQREKTAKKLSAKLEQVLRSLDIPAAVFSISVNKQGQGTDIRYSPNGWDAVQFMFSANLGEAPKPLNKVASGGELSRTLLALKTVVSEAEDVGVLVFDEIDTGVSGSAAGRIAEQLLALGRRGQVLCVTHSAAIAASASMHFEIVKETVHQHTLTHAVELDAPGRVREIARLLGTGGSDETAIEHAKALLNARYRLPV